MKWKLNGKIATDQAETSCILYIENLFHIALVLVHHSNEICFAQARQIFVTHGRCMHPIDVALLNFQNQYQCNFLVNIIHFYKT